MPILHPKPCRIHVHGQWYHIDSDGTVYPTDTPTSSRWVDGPQVDEETANRVKVYRYIQELLVQ